MRPLTEIADAAVAVFTDRGFRLAGISDVASALGLSHGALYTYVDSKQALLYLALMRAIEPEEVTLLPIPVVAPPPAQIVAMMRKWAARQAPTTAGSDQSGISREQELSEVIDLLYRVVEENRRVLELVARCAEELPELARWYFVEQRRKMLAELAEYLSERIRSGRLRPVPDVAVAARFIVETIAWFAMHRHGDPDSAMLADDECRRTVRHLLLAAFLPADAGPTPRQGVDDNGRHR